MQSSKSSLHGLCSSLSRHPATTSRGMSGRWAADFKGCIEKTEMYQRSDPHQISCRGTKVYYWEQALEGTSYRLVWSSLSRAKSKCLSGGTSPTYNLFPISAPLTFFLRDMASCQLTSKLHFLCNGTLALEQLLYCYAPIRWCAQPRAICYCSTFLTKARHPSRHENPASMKLDFRFTSGKILKA